MWLNLSCLDMCCRKALAQFLIYANQRMKLINMLTFLYSRRLMLVIVTCLRCAVLNHLWKVAQSGISTCHRDRWAISLHLNETNQKVCFLSQRLIQWRFIWKMNPKRTSVSTNKSSWLEATQNRNSGSFISPRGNLKITIQLRHRRTRGLPISKHVATCTAYQRQGSW